MWALYRRGMGLGSTTHDSALGSPSGPRIIGTSLPPRRLVTPAQAGAGDADATKPHGQYARVRTVTNAHVR